MTFGEAMFLAASGTKVYRSSQPGDPFILQFDALNMLTWSNGKLAVITREMVQVHDWTILVERCHHCDQIMEKL